MSKKYENTTKLKNTTKPIKTTTKTITNTTNTKPITNTTKSIKHSTKHTTPKKYTKYTNIPISNLTPTIDLITSDSIDLSNKDFINLLSSFKYLSKSELALLLYIDYIQRYNLDDIDYIQRYSLDNIDYTHKYNPTNTNNLNIIDFCNLTGTCRASFYAAYKSLIDKGIISKDLCNIVDTTHSKRKEKNK